MSEILTTIENLIGPWMPLIIGLLVFGMLADVALGIVFVLRVRRRPSRVDLVLARDEAFKRYDGDTIIDDNTGEEVSHDDWGYAETARQAFIAGVAWATNQPNGSE